MYVSKGVSMCVNVEAYKKSRTFRRGTEWFLFHLPCMSKDLKMLTFINLYSKVMCLY